MLIVGPLWYAKGTEYCVNLSILQVVMLWEAKEVKPTNQNPWVVDEMLFIFHFQKNIILMDPRLV